MASARTYVIPGISGANHKAIRRLVKNAEGRPNMATVTNTLLDYAMSVKKKFKFPDGPRRGPKPGSKRKSYNKRKNAPKRKK